MRKLLLILPFLAVLALLASGMRLLAFAAGQPYESYHADLTGVRVLDQRADVDRRLAAGYDVLFAGTSRTMADFDAPAVASALTAGCGLSRPLTGYNAGKIADSYGAFRARLERGKLPKLLVLEFSPHVMLSHASGGDAPQPEATLYDRYRTDLRIGETYFSGGLLGALGLDDMINVRPGQIVLIARALRRYDNRIFARLYYMLRAAQGSGLKVGPAGQIYYRIYFPDRAAAELVGDVTSEYRHYISLLAPPPDPEAWRNFVQLLDLFGGERQVVVVRPPVSARLYALENEKQGALVARVRAYLRGRGIPYIDLNGGDYYSTDESHIDWYDTARLTRDLARRLAPDVRRGLFAPGAACAPR